MSTKVSIFYSWQSDSSASTNKNFIDKALRTVAQKISEDHDLEILLAIDRDTQGVPGSPTIADTIFEKIENSDLFVADVSIVTKEGSPRSIPNPNVLIELGYAGAKLGWERVITIMNDRTGGPTKLPFDLKHRRWPLLYSLSVAADQETIDREVTGLSDRLEYAIRQAAESGLFTRKMKPKDVIVARRLKFALDAVIGMVAIFLRNYGIEDGTLVFVRLSSSEIPETDADIILIEPILNAFQGNSLLTLSTYAIGGKQLNWVELFEREFDDLRQDCNRTLNQYAGQDDMLIEIIETIHNCAGNLAAILNVTKSHSELLKLYADGMPDAHTEWLRQFFLYALKAYRITSQFT